MQQSDSYHPWGNAPCTVIVKWLSIVVCLLGSVMVRAQDGKRQFGPLLIDFNIDSVRHTAICQFSADNKTLASVMVGLNGTGTFSISQPGFSSRGILSIKQDAAKTGKELNVNLWYKSGKDSVSYNGALAIWPSVPAVGDTVFIPDFILAPLLTARVKVWGPSKNIALVSLINGEAVVYSIALTQPSPFAYTTDDIILGDLVIKKGMSVKLSIPSAITKGSILLNAQYITTDHPLTPFNAIIASWPL